MKSSGDTAEDGGPPLSQRLVKLGLAIGALVILYFVGHEMFGNLLTGTRRSKLDGDYIEVSKAIERWELDAKKPFLEWDLDKLQGTTLGATVRDPDGHPYVYDWFFRRFVYAGPDGLLQSVVPGKTAEPGDSDDEVRPLAAMDRLVYARPEGAGTVIELARADGSEPKELATVPGPVLAVHGLPAKDANLVVLTVPTATGSQLSLLDTGATPPVLTPLTKGDAHDAWPTLLGAKIEWVFYQSDADTKNPKETHIYKLSYKDRVPAKLTSGVGHFVQPSVELKSRWVWFVATQPSGSALWRFQLSNYAEPQVRLNSPTRVLKCPAPSASGEYLAYLVGSGATDTLEVIDAKSSKVIFTASGVVPDSRICWSPDDAKVGYLVIQDGAQRMVLAHVAKNVSITLPTNVTGRGFAWLHD